MNVQGSIKAIVSKPGEGQPLPVVGRVRVSSAQTGGAFEVIELGTPPGGGGPPPHIHHDHEEYFYIIQGTFTFLIGEQKLEAPAGSVAWVPRGMRHAFQATDGARALGFIMPAGLEGFFRELGAGLMAGRPDGELRAELARKYDSDPVE
ncbi:MAG: cupin domain-containing protein [Deltaproteobacteria bacterium]